MFASAIFAAVENVEYRPRPQQPQVLSTKSRSTITATLPSVPVPAFSDRSPAIDRLDGAVDSPADMRHHQPWHRPLHRESHAALEEGLCLVIQGGGFGEVAQYVDVDMLSTALGQD